MSDVGMLDTSSVVRIPVGNGPITDIDVSPDGARLYVTNYGHDSASVVDTRTGRVVETIRGLSEPSAIALSGEGPARAYVLTARAAYDAIDVIDAATNRVVATHRLALSVSDMAVSADGQSLFVCRNGAPGADVAVLDSAGATRAVVELATVPGTTAEFVRISADGTRLYVGTNGPCGGRIVVIDPRARPARGGPRVVDVVDLGLPVRDLALSADGGTAYVASYGPVVGAVLDVIDTGNRKIVTTRKIGEITGVLTRLALSRDGNRAYLLSEDAITVVSSRTQDVIDDVRVTAHPSAVVESPDGRSLYIADHGGMVTVASSVPAPGREPSLARREPAPHEAALV
ncbi:YncE family protein [Mycobacterium parmense]|uniref:Uncharacterized protein n=1 Tax=Mycobacterium parmense TaxID=185642 RepID=A0A7I7Z255_9MYCO|nr:YncE family protein [Mycobacterium parmense]MCV7349395.1 YncE family protein [Mycobacterium parmense]ORW57340.1 hypothetical protein AWC20_14625 [Mycobacterium parmense]BBZ48258.1 hypothetical protein MPRM_55390 [Mycobacterium parmense]